MNKIVDLKNDPISKLFLNYLIPSITGMLVMSLHVILNGIFVGRGVGSDGLAAVNIVVPFFSIFAAIGLLMGLGGATIVSIKFGEGKSEEANSIFTQSTLFALLTILIIVILCELNIETLSYALGANDKILPLVKEYMRILLYFSPVIVITDTLCCFVRNDGAPKLSMYVMILGAALNCILDYIFIFVFHLGVGGAALGTGIGNSVSLILLLSHFIFKKGNLRFVKTNFVLKNIVRIFRNGLPNFLTEMSLAVVTLTYNLIFMRLLGETGVSAYSIVNYIHALMLMVFMGIAQAAQPIISYNYGAKEYGRVRKTYTLSLFISMIFGVCFFLSGVFFGESMVKLFNNTDAALIKVTTNGIAIYFVSYLFMGINMVTVGYFQAIEKSSFSTILCLCRGLVFIMITLLVLPKLFNINGIWLTTPVAELFTIFICYYFVKFQPSYGKLQASTI